MPSALSPGSPALRQESPSDSRSDGAEGQGRTRFFPTVTVTVPHAIRKPVIQLLTRLAPVFYFDEGVLNQLKY